jgi:iron complex transport system substrate-binding protein
VRVLSLYVPLLLSLLCIESAVAESLDITDITGRKVNTPARVERVLTTCTSVTDTLLRLKQKQIIAGCDEYSIMFPEMSGVAVLAHGGSISRENVIASRIDLAFIWWYQDEMAEQLANLNIPVVRIKLNSAKDIPQLLRLVGRCVNQKESSEKMAIEIEQYLSQTANNQTLVCPTVYWELYTPFRTAGADSYLNDLLQLAGGVNLVSTPGSLQFSAERLLQSNPEVVLLVDGYATATEFASRTGLSGLSAVKNNRVYCVPKQVLVAGAGLPVSVAVIRKIISGKK